MLSSNGIQEQQRKKNTHFSDTFATQASLIRTPILPMSLFISICSALFVTSFCYKMNAIFSVKYLVFACKWENKKGFMCSTSNRNRSCRNERVKWISATKLLIRSSSVMWLLLFCWWCKYYDFFKMCVTNVFSVDLPLSDYTTTEHSVAHSK